MNDLRFMELVSNWLDGSLTETESAELQTVLESSADRRSEFVDVCGLDADLRLMSEVVIETPVSADSLRESTKAKGVSARVVILAAVAAVLLLAIGYGIGLDRNRDAEPQIAASEVASNDSDEVVEAGCAVLSRVVDAKFAGEVQYQEGDSLQPGQLKLLSGAVQIDFFSGATMLIDEAAEVQLISSWEAECAQGKVTMHVPPPAIGFRLTLPGMKVVDLGTEFAVQVDGAESSLHVFDGEVEAHVPGSQMQIIREGSSLKKATDLPVVAGVSNPADFPSVEEFERRKEEYYQTKTKQWRTAMNEVRSDERIIGCYQFWRWEDEKWDRLVNNFAIPKRPYSHGSAVGARWVDGRWPSKPALEFKSPGDRVRINLGKDEYEGLTMAAWLRVDGLDRKYNALLLSDGYEDGEPHWQIDQSGRLMFSVNYLRSPNDAKQKRKPNRQNQIYYTPPIFNAAGRRWHHIAVTFDATTGEAVQYFDGKEVSREFSEHHQDGRQVTFGACEIGNWGLPIEGESFPVRNLNGRVDEFLIYQEPLSGDEITNLYELGVPN
ncbi:LamG-like jellyroll fold domain-containing protein [Rubripirellula reticaptiva]|uniref:FecR protein n=1 Tax=Rubripirellula reticaptiva TaxID=2528013 RepID=A0A5C6FDT1_9BACT|nr:LamG-like jellyroll fold domain-containing protein [Rubripirellula reticaptiva]TWU58364.1 FecR protein [Rubripirellula reticaptiva]